MTIRTSSGENYLRPALDQLVEKRTKASVLHA
jgi:hypothetical protein